MAPTTDAPKLLKRQKLGKGKKKAWRASNVKELHDFLDDERRQVESGGLVSQKADEKLFTIDTKKPQKQVTLKRLGSKKEQHRNRPLRAWAILEPSQHIETVAKPLPENYRKGRKTLKLLDHLKDKATSRECVLAVKRKQDNAKRDVKRQKELTFEVANDIWNEGENTAKVKVYRPKRLKAKPSKLSATIIPHPGASVNPTYEDHQDLLQGAVETEETKRKKAMKIANCLRPRVPRSEAATPTTHFEEMAAGLVDDSESENETEVKKDEDSDDDTSVRMPQRKSKRQRRHETNLKSQMRDKKAEKERRRQEDMVEKVRILKREIRQQEEKEEARVEVKLKLKEEEPYRTKRLGKVKYEEPAVDLKLSEELVAHMREVTPEGHILKDVYSSMLKRNIMEPRVKQPKKRKSVKLYIKKTHMDKT